jgi:Leucine-rich repeat (LRR) protein
MASNKRFLKAYARFDGSGRIVPSSTILRKNKPKVGEWKETPAYLCCNPTPSDLEIFFSRMNSCYSTVTDLIPNIFYFSDEGDGTFIDDGCEDIWDDGNFFNTNLTQLFDNIKEDKVDIDPSLSIPYTHTQQDDDICPYLNPPIDGVINDGSEYFGQGSTYFTNMYPGMFVLAAAGVNVDEFSITGNLGSDGNGNVNAFIVNISPGWTAFVKTIDESGDPSLNHIILINGDVSGATQLYDGAADYDDHCVQGLGSQNNTIITVILATEEYEPALTEEEVLAISNQILNVYNTQCTSTTTTIPPTALFDVTADWSLVEVVDEASFRTFLEQSNNFQNVVITDFSLVANRLTCNLSAFAYRFYLTNIDVSVVNGIGNIIELQKLYLSDNEIVTFDPLIPLPSSLKELWLDNNQIVTFDPSIALPSSLRQLSLAGNQIVTFDPTIALPNSLQELFLNNNQIVDFDPSIALPNSLQELYLSTNQIVTFNPSIPLPGSLNTLDLAVNQMTTAGYTGSEPWANAMTVIPSRGNISFSGNIDTVSGTNLETILTAKGWTVNL